MIKIGINNLIDQLINELENEVGKKRGQTKYLRMLEKKCSVFRYCTKEEFLLKVLNQYRGNDYKEIIEFRKYKGVYYYDEGFDNVNKLFEYLLKFTKDVFFEKFKKDVVGIYSDFEKERLRMEVIKEIVSETDVDETEKRSFLKKLFKEGR